MVAITTNDPKSHTTEMRISESPSHKNLLAVIIRDPTITPARNRG